VGHAFIKSAMRRLQAIFAMELSGPCCYADPRYTDNGLRTIIEPLLRLNTGATSQSRLLHASQTPLFTLGRPVEKIQAKSD
jgi:phosphomannomutase